MTRVAAIGLLNGEAAQELIRDQLLMRLGYVGSDGYPRVVPVGYIWQGDAFVVCTAENAPKVRALRANPKVAFTIDTETQPPQILLVRGTAEVQMVDGIPPEYLEASRKGIPADQWADFENQVRGLYKRMARIRIKPEWAKLIDFKTSLPQAIEQLVAQ